MKRLGRRQRIAILIFFYFSILFILHQKSLYNDARRKDRAKTEPALYADEARKKLIWSSSFAELNIKKSPSTSRSGRLAPSNRTAKTTTLKTIPRTIYTFWDSEPTPFLITACLANWRKMNPSHTVTLITYSNLASVIDLSVTPLPRNFASIHSRYQADWIRLAVLLQKGGIWVDASFIMLRSLEKIHSIQEQDQSEGFQFYMETSTKFDQYPILENWLIASIPNSRLIKAWFLEWCFCIEEFALGDNYLHNMTDTYGLKEYTNIKQNMDCPEYLKQHVALQKILQVDKIALPSFSGAIAQPDGPFSLIDALDWSSFSFVDHLILKWTPLPNHPSKPSFIKLRGWERTVLDLQITQGWTWFTRFWFWNIRNKRFWRVECGSIYCDYLGGPMNDVQCLKCY